MAELDSIIQAFDEELEKSEIPFLSLAQANNLLVTKGLITSEQREAGFLKKLLEENKITNASQTTHAPKQWRIFPSHINIPTDKKIIKAVNVTYFNCPNCGIGQSLSQGLKSERILVCSNCDEEFKNPFYQDTIIQNKYYNCPKCKIGLIIKDELKKDKKVNCPNCNTDFPNPRLKKVENSGLKKAIFKSEEIKQKKYGNYVLLILIILISSYYYSNYYETSDSGQGEGSSTGYYINHEVFAFTSEALFDEYMEYALHNDIAAMQSMILAGDVYELSAGTKVYLVESRLTHTVVRLPGTRQHLYIVGKALSSE